MLYYKQKTIIKFFFWPLRAIRTKLFIPAFLLASLVGLLVLLSAPASTTKYHNPYLEEELPYPLLPLPYSPDKLAHFDEAITSLLQNHRFNGTVLLARQGMIIYQNAFGYADFRNHTPVSNNTPFQLASISKTFTATAVLMLHEEGKIDIDDPINKHIKEFPYPQMTIRQMLNHTSGIQNYMWLVERYWSEERLPDNEDILRLFIRYPRPVNFSAGTRFEYSNTGYAFLALLVERVEKQRFSDFLHERMFHPLEMHDAFAYDPNNPSSLPEHRAAGFRPGRRSFIYNGNLPHDAVLGDKGIYASTNDLYKWDQAIYRHALISGTTWQQAFEPAILRNQRTVNYGQGWRLQSYLDGRVVYHPGRWNGFRTSFKRFVDNKATLILLSNNGRDINAIVDRLQEILFEEEIALLAKTSQDANPIENNPLIGESGPLSGGEE